MKTKLSFFKNNSRGFTLTETLVVVGIIGLLMGGITILFRDLYVDSRQESMATNTIDQARMYTATFVNEIRNLAYGADGSYPISNMTSSGMTYYTTYNTGGVIEKVVYSTSGGTVSKTYTAPTGTPPTYGVAGQKQTVTMPNNLFPSLSFSYYDGSFNGFTTAPLTTPWTNQAVSVVRNWATVAYGNGVFVGLADTSTGTDEVMTSPDGIHWTPQHTPPANRKWKGIAFGNGIFVAVANDGTTHNDVMYSSDGVSWQTGTPGGISGVPAANAWSSITYGGGLFVAVASCPGGVCPSKGVMTSPDGQTWTGVTTSGSLSKSWQNVTYGNGTYVAVSSDNLSNNIMSSTNGSSWKIRTVPGPHVWYGVAYGNGTFVAVAHDNSAVDVVTSPDGITWTAQSGVSTALWTSVAFGGGEFVAVADTGSASNDIMISTDGITWTTMTSPSTSSTGFQWRDVTYGNGLFVAVGIGSGVSSPSDYYIMIASDSNIASGVYTGASLPTPANVNLVKYVEMSLTGYKNDSPGSTSIFTVTDGATIRNLKTNLGN